MALLNSFYKTLLFLSLLFVALLEGTQWGKKGPGSPVHSTKVPGPSGSLGPILFRPGTFSGPSRDFTGQDSPAGKPST